VLPTSYNPLAENRAVIVHDENGIASGAGAASPGGDYIYWFDTPENACDEQSIAFNNTWGPTLADGDDYEMDGDFLNITAVTGSGFFELPPNNVGNVNVNGEKGRLRTTAPVINGVPASLGSNPVDDFDLYWTNTPAGGTHSAGAGIGSAGFVNSVAEVDEAIRAAGDSFTAYYMDALAGDTFDKSGFTTGGLITQFLSFFPTKFFYFEIQPNGKIVGCAPASSFTTLNAFVADAVARMMSVPKGVNAQLWGIKEQLASVTSNAECISPATDPACFTTTTGIALPFEVGVMGVDFMTRPLGGDLNPPWDKGKVVIDLVGDGVNPGYIGKGAGSPGWAGLMYAFEWDTNNFPLGILTHWRSMQR
jgi:hypothetical protein